MSEAFLKVVNMSISAGWLVLAVLVLRLILKKAPKWVNVLLWGIVAVRLICPFSIESALSLIPSTETISPEIMMDWTPEISTGIETLDRVVNPVISTSFAPQEMASANPLQILIPVAANLWLLGVLILMAYTAISYLTLRHKLRTAVILRDNIFQCETVSSPFVLGIVKPKIYLPYGMDDQNLRHVIAHEQAHIRRKDHWWKPLGFLLLTIHWFNPLMWVAYILLCRDIELACDEKVIAELGNEQRADYTQALVSCAVNRRMIAACPLAFGEVSVKERVKSVMNYKKPAFWIILLAVIVCAIVAVCFLTNPVAEDAQYSWNKCYLREAEQTEVRKAYNRATQPLPVTIKFESTSGPLEIELIYSLKVNGGEDWQYSDPIKLNLGESTEFSVPADNHFCVSATPVTGQNGYVTFRFTDGVGGSGDPRKVIEWFDFTEDPSETSNELELNIQIDEFPGITFKYMPHDIIATTNWDGSDLTGNTILISGMPIWNAHFCDLTGDGKPEICSQVSYGSGIIDNRVIIYDYANGVSYKLEDRGYHDYYLRSDGANLYVDKRVYRSDEAVSSGRLIFKDGCIQIEGVDTAPTNVLQAKVLEIHDDYYLVEPVEGSWELSSASKIEVPMKNIETSPEPQVGDTLLIEYDGQIAETYPARITNPLHISVLVEVQTSEIITAFEFNFAGNTSGGQKMELTEDKPYWCITVVNEGTNGINIDILGTIYMVDAGTTGHIYPDKAWDPGTYSIDFGTSGGIGMEGYAICGISSAPFQAEEPYARKIYNAERRDDHPLVVYISSEWAIDKKSENLELPFNHLLIKEDGSGLIDGVDVTWEICDKYTSEKGLHIELWDDNEYVVSVVYWRDSQLLQIVDQNDNLVECYYHRIAYATG